MTLQDAFNLALEHHRAGRLADAEIIYRQILAQYPNQPEAHYMLGALAQQAGQTQIAMQFVTDAIRIGPIRAEYHATYGELLEASERYDDALEAYQSALALNNNLPTIHNNLGNILATRGDLETAIKHFKDALIMQPDLVMVNYNLGRAYAALGQSPDAIAQFQQVLSLQPDHLDAMHALGRALAITEGADAAIAKYKEALAASMKMPAAERSLPAHSRSVARILTSLGDALGDNGQLEPAAHCFEGAMKLAPDQFHSFFNYSVCLLHMKRYEEVVTVCRDELKRQPDFPNLYYNLGCALLRLDRIEEARAAYLRASELMAPTDEKVSLGQELRRASLFQESIECLRGLVAKGTRSMDQRAYWEMMETSLIKVALSPPADSPEAGLMPKLPYLGDKVILLHCDREVREKLRSAGLHGGYAIDPRDGSEVWMSAQLAAQPDPAKLPDLVEQWLQWIRNEAAMAGTTCTIWMPQMPEAVADAVRQMAGEDLIEMNGGSADEIHAQLAARAITPPDTEDKCFAVVSIRNGGVELLPHWLEHYTNLGVDEILLGIFDDLAGDAQTEIEKCAHRWKFRTFAQNWKAATESETYFQRQSGCRRAGARPGTWILHTDLDELQQYPAPLKEITAEATKLNINVLFGRFFDRVAADGSLPTIQPHPSLWQQFPVECNMTGGVLKSLPQKVMLARFRVLVKTGHHEAPLERANPSPIGKVAHFKWHGGLLNRMRWGLKQDNASREWKADTRRFLDWLDRHGGRINLSDPALGARMPRAMGQGFND